MSFSVRFEQMATESAQAATEMVYRATKKLVGDLKIYDLMFEGEKPLGARHGVYLFFSPENECLYVGKNSAQSFIERIPWHFALWEASWMNHFLKGVRKYQGFNSLIEAADYSRNHQLLLVPVSGDDWSSIGALEKFFRVFLKPTFNAYSDRYISRHQHLDLSKPLREVLEVM